MNSYRVKVIRVGEPEPSMKCDTPEIAQSYWSTVIEKQDWFEENKEALVVLLLSTRYNVTGYNLVALRSLNESIAHPREVFRPVIVGGAYAFILMHNHPSGDSSPSQNDHSLTRRLAEGAELLQVKMLDHIIVGRAEAGRPGYFSFKEAGVL